MAVHQVLLAWPITQATSAPAVPAAHSQCRMPSALFGLRQLRSLAVLVPKRARAVAFCAVPEALLQQLQLLRQAVALSLELPGFQEAAQSPLLTVAVNRSLSAPTEVHCCIMLTAARRERRVASRDILQRLHVHHCAGVQARQCEAENPAGLSQPPHRADATESVGV